ncbi:MAG: molybdopterin converting factor, subunit 1, partial [Phycisphaerales bacterium]|nr:molybdopterin converting factor, subunit 1 [Phycisphaerales bacterium]MDB5358378.1 molybdopterin converting factor, subunit 1 [Phycisphaerales bacterium]
MKILFINNHGGGFADHIEVEQGTTVAQLFAQKM